MFYFLLVLKITKEIFTDFAEKFQKSMQNPRYYVPKVVRIRRTGGEIVQGCDVYIGRAQTQGGWKLDKSVWHNPFSVKEYGLEQSLILYRKHMLELIASDPETWRNNFGWLVSQNRVLTLGC